MSRRAVAVIALSCCAMFGAAACSSSAASRSTPAASNRGSADTVSPNPMPNVGGGGAPPTAGTSTTNP